MIRHVKLVSEDRSTIEPQTSRVVSDYLSFGIIELWFQAAHNRRCGLPHCAKSNLKVDLKDFISSRPCSPRTGEFEARPKVRISLLFIIRQPTSLFILSSLVNRSRRASDQANAELPTLAVNA
jgi:hypothetical protein